MERGEATGRFTELVRRAPDDVPLDRCAFLIAAHDHTVDVEAQLARLDDLARRCPEPTLDGLRRHLFLDEEFAGNRDDYEDPANSYLDLVLDRGVGLPITLSVLTIEVGRRLGLDIGGVSAPGHFLVRHGELVFDPFHGGRILSEGEAQLVLAQTPEVAPTPMILERMLVNLQQRYATLQDRESLTWVTRLRLRFPHAKARTAWLN